MLLLYSLLQDCNNKYIIPFTFRGHWCFIGLKASNLISIHVEKAYANSLIFHIGYFRDLLIFNFAIINFQGL